MLWNIAAKLWKGLCCQSLFLHFYHNHWPSNQLWCLHIHSWLKICHRWCQRKKDWVQGWRVSSPDRRDKVKQHWTLQRIENRMRCLLNIFRWGSGQVNLRWGNAVGRQSGTVMNFRSRSPPRYPMIWTIYIYSWKVGKPLTHRFQNHKI